MNTTVQSQIAPFAEICRQHLTAAQPNATEVNGPELSASENKIIAEAGRALKAWEASPEGQAKLQAMQGMSLAEIRQELIGLLQSPIFTPTLELIHNASLSVLNNPIKSISAAIKIEVEFILGFSGSIGVAIDPSKLIQFLKDPTLGTLDYSSFLTGWLDDGVTAGGFVGAEVGISGSEPSDMGGYSTGFEATFDVDDTGTGISGQIYWGTSAGSWGATVGLVEGADAGIEKTRSWTVILTDSDFTIPAIYQPDADHFMIIDSIFCVNSNKDTDHVYFNFTIDNGTTYRYPTWDHRNMSEDKDTTPNNNWNAGRSIKFNQQVEVTLFSESDSGVGADDQLGDTVTFKASSFVASQEAKSTHGINETLYWINATLLF